MAKYGSFKYAGWVYGPTSPLVLDSLQDKDHNKIPRSFNVGSINANLVNLSWSAPVNTEGVSGYNVYRAYTYDLAYAKIGTTLSTGFIDSGVEYKRSYYYAVTTVYSGTESTNYFPQDVKASYLTGLSAPANYVSWQAPQASVSGYKLYYSNRWDGVLSGLGVTTGVNYTHSGLDQSLPYYYRVTSLY